MESKENIPFEDLLNALQEPSVPLPPRFLYRLTDIFGDELEMLSAIWSQITVGRRINLLEDLEELEDTNHIYSFESLYQLALDDDEPAIRVIGIRALWDYEDIQLIPTLLDILDNDMDPQVRAQAATGLGRFVYLGALEEISGENMAEIEDKLLEVIGSEAKEIIRQRALESLGFSSRDSVHDLIEEYYSYGDEQWVTSSLVAMGRTADREWEPYVLEKLDDENLQIRTEAIRAAGDLALEEAVPTLLEMLENDERESQMAAAWALSEIGGEGVLDGLESLLDATESEEDFEYFESAIENLRLNEEINELNLIEFSEEDFEELIDPTSSEEPQD